MSLEDRFFKQSPAKYWSPLTSESNLQLYGQGLVRLPDYLLPITTTWYQAQHRLSEEQVVDLGQLADLSFSGEALPAVFFFLVMGYLPRELPQPLAAEDLLNLLDLADFVGWSDSSLSIYGHLWPLLPLTKSQSLLLYLRLTRSLSRVKADSPTYQFLLELVYRYNDLDPEAEDSATSLIFQQSEVKELLIDLDTATLLTAIRLYPYQEDSLSINPATVPGSGLYLLLNGLDSFQESHLDVDGQPQGTVILPNVQLPVKRLYRDDLPFGLKSVFVSNGQPPTVAYLTMDGDLTSKAKPCLGDLIVKALDSQLTGQEVADLSKLVFRLYAHQAQYSAVNSVAYSLFIKQAYENKL